MILDAESALDISTGLNFNHLSGDLGGFSHVECLKDNWVIPSNPTEEDEQDNELFRFCKLREVLDSYKQEEVTNES